MNKRFIYLLLIGMFWACAETSTQTTNENTTTIQDTSEKKEQTPTGNTPQTLDQAKFSLQYPTGWTVTKGNTPGQLATLTTEQTSAQDQFREQVHITLQRSSTEAFTLKKLAGIIEKQVTKEVKAINITDKETKNDYFEMEYIGNMDGRKMKWKKRAWVKNKEALIMTYLAEFENFDKYIKEVNEMMGSFKAK
ncbi:MAG TPA: hypothetical protein DCS93_38295 [Microscillaceae bacterium]|nr:hypothetical protein [Microscillaceae bacterium]